MLLDLPLTLPPTYAEKENAGIVLEPLYGVQDRPKGVHWGVVSRVHQDEATRRDVLAAEGILFVRDAPEVIFKRPRREDV